MTTDRIAALLRKYQTMRALRHAAAGNEAREQLRTLAREFPGALRELDRIESNEIDARIAALSAGLGGAPLPRWCAWMDAYHTWMRRALALRRREHVAEASPAFIEQVSRPEHGRLMIAVFDQLAREFATPREEIWNELFPSKTPRAYRARADD